MTSYLAGDSLFGGNTYTGNDVEPTIEAYENVFGPAGRDVKLDQQRHRRRGRWHLPDILKGPNQYLTDRVDGLITDPKNSPFTSFILPYKQIDNPDGKIKWNVWSFDEGLASRVPYESAARTLTQSKRSFKGFPVRHGLALNLEHNFMMSEAGRRNFHNQLNQLIGSIQMTNDLDVHVALLMAPSYEKHMKEKYILDSDTPSQKCRQFVDLFGFMQKNVNALDILIEEAKARLKSWGSEMPNFMLANSKLTFGLQMTPERTNYQTQGPEGVKRLKQGPEIDSYRGINIIHSRSFSMETGVPPRDVLRRRVRVAEYYRIPPSEHNASRTFEFYNEDRDTWFTMTFNDLLKHAILGNGSPDDQLLENMSNLPPAPPGGITRTWTRGDTDGSPGLGAPSIFNTVDLTVSRAIRGPLAAGGAPPRDDFNDYVYSSGYRNPSMNLACQLNIRLAVAASPWKKWIEAGIVRKSQHKIKEFYRIVAKHHIDDNQIAKAFRVYQQLGQCDLSDLGGGPGDMTLGNRFLADSVPPYPINYNDVFFLKHANNDPFAAANLCPNWRFTVGNAQNIWVAIATETWATKEMNDYFLGSVNGSDAGTDFRQTLLYQLALYSDKYIGQPVWNEFKNILQNVGLNAGDLRKQAAKKFTDAIKMVRGRARCNSTLAKLVCPVGDDHWATAVPPVPIWNTNLLAQWECETEDTIEATVLGEANVRIPNFINANVVLTDQLTIEVLQFFAYRYFANRLMANDINHVANVPPAADLWNTDLNGNFYEPPPEDDPNYEAQRQKQNVEIVIVRPNIEHHMFGIILGRGGDQLGNTFWGQTELSCYDDAQHGIWGMSYKYHERAIVINERNLIRLWDIGYDGYVGGKDDRVVLWDTDGNALQGNRDSYQNFKDATRNISKHYHGPSMMIMAFIHREGDTVNNKGCQQNWPSPIIFHDQMYHPQSDNQGIVTIDPEGADTVQTAEFRVFDRNIPAYATRYDQYYNKMPDFTRMALNRKPAGIATSENEVCSDMLAFQGSMRIKENNGNMYEVTGSGHHGNDFVGVASLRAGKGYRIQSQPQLSRAA